MYKRQGLGQISGNVATSSISISERILILFTLSSSISLSLAVINLLPFPALDGGRLAFLFIEIFRRGKKVPERVLVILDEAYFEYASHIKDFPDSMHYRYDNVITLRTFSKVYGLAGLRVGYGFGHEDLIANLLKVKLPFEPSIPAQEAAIIALDDS